MLRAVSVGLIAAALAAAAVYLLCTFVAWDFNPGDWPPIGRLLTALLGGMAMTTAGLIAAEAESYSRRKQ